MNHPDGNSAWTAQQRSAVSASFLSWTFDAFDFFLLIFVLPAIAAEFGTGITEVTLAVTLTLATRPIGAFIFGRAADRYGRRPALVAVIGVYSALEFASAFAPNLIFLLVIRALFGVAMGGVWGVSASLTMESIPPARRGFASGLLQAGYPAGYLLASLAFGFLFPVIGWRGLFVLGAIPALLSVFVIRQVQESPTWRSHGAGERIGTLQVLRTHWKLAVYAVVLMTAFNFFSHSTGDLYPTFLQVDRGLSPEAVGIIAVVYNIGAILGCLLFGSLSERIGRRRAIVGAALLSLPIVPLWIMPESLVLLAIGAFLMQLMVQGAWGVIPAHLNELSPPEVRATFPGFVYQLGNLFASANTTIQAAIAAHDGNRYGLALASVAAFVALIIAVLTGFGFEAKGVRFAATGARVAPASERNVQAVTGANSVYPAE
jgi:SHS family lactate transporter-like MFS transporter